MTEENQTIELNDFERRALVAAAKVYRHLLAHGNLPGEDALKEIYKEAGDGMDFASPEDVDDIVEKLSPAPRPASAPRI